ncbi:SDR family oxidoreductase [Phanerochaete sordida]|uniref:SDR family oxidoreductase n=1 Tax=Phanerochaete sordida TaxID=48140 RepID=A0A9P3GRI5_9APHY|nr:SDR family oxidoreductase [Phanerochaete sordida]
MPGHYIGEDFLPTNKHDVYPAIEAAKADLRGKVVVITGASRGLGQATATAMAAGGASGLALLARGDLAATAAACRAAACASSNLQVLTLTVDVTDEAQVAAAAAQVQDAFGRVDVVINNAGHLEHWALVAESEPGAWWRSFEVNVRGTYLVTRAFLPLLVACGGAKTVVNVTTAGAVGFLPRYSAYSISKLAMLRLAEWLGHEYGDAGVLAHAVHPGMVMTDMAATLPPEFVGAPIWDDVPALPAHTLLWLVRERREWLAGRYVDCRWDVEALLARRQEVVDGDKLKVNLVV